MTEAPKPPVAPPIQSSRGDDDLLQVVKHALLYKGRRRVDDAAAFGAQLLAERVLDAIRTGYEIKPKPPQPYPTSADHPIMNGGRRD